jgi:hypothetical protein
MIRGQIVGQTSDFVQIIPPDFGSFGQSSFFSPEAFQSLPQELAWRTDMPHGHDDSHNAYIPRINAPTHPRHLAPSSISSPQLIRNPEQNGGVPTPSAVTVEELLELVQEQRKVIDLMEAQQKMQQDFADDPVEASSWLLRLEEMQREQVRR